MVYSELFAEVIANIYRIIASPLSDLNIFWTLVPIYVTLIAAEYFSRGQTDYQDAFMSGFLAVWTGVNWYQEIGFAHSTRFYITAAVVLLGAIVTIESMLGKRLIKTLAKSQYIALTIIILTPYIYNLIEPTYTVLISAVVLFLIIAILPFILRKVLPIPE